MGNDYHAHLTDDQKVIPERTPEKVAKAREYKAIRKRGDPVPGLDDWNIRWVGPDGYKGMVVRQLKAFREAQAARAREESAGDD